MRVYVESNFVLEQALQQEQCEACESILQLASAGRISLCVPAFSLAEPHQALTLKDKARNRLSIAPSNRRALSDGFILLGTSAG